jgi:thymidylate synthase
MQHSLILGNGTTIIDPQGGSAAMFGGTCVLEVGPQMLRPAGQPYHGELQYLGILQELVDRYDDPEHLLRQERTGTGTQAVFGRQMRFDLKQGFPLLTTKRLYWPAVAKELLWMLSGSTDNTELNDVGVHIWDEWAGENGDLGPIYGKQWRSWTGAPEHSYGEERYFDQIKAVIKSLKDNPGSRRHVVSAWNVADLDDMALAPCHCLFQFFVEDDRLSCQLYQRSADMFLGVPFNIASYALLTHLIARAVGLVVGELVWVGGDTHLYSNHVDQAKEQLSRTPTSFPTLDILGDKDIFDITFDDLLITGYEPHPSIKAKVSV